MRSLPRTHSCFVCGKSNPIGLKLRSETDGRVVRARFVPSAEHVGFKETVHGGIIATLLDEVMVWACAVQTKRFSFCAELNVRFVRPVRPHQPFIATAELVANRRDKIFEAKAELRDESGEVFATGNGKYLPVKDADAKEMATDFADDASWITDD
jgi:uncharacterized protein (TIGR00369 family)